MRTEGTIEGWAKAFEIIADELCIRTGRKFTQGEIEKAIYALISDELECEWMLDMIDADYELKDLVNRLLNNSWVFESVELELEDDFLESWQPYQRKVEIKIKGVKWICHRNDNDPFPSLPHVHNYDGNYKMDLRNGNCYHNRRFKEKVNMKKLLRVRDELKRKNVMLPELD